MDEASGVLIAPPPRSSASATLNEQLDAHLKGWKQAAASIANYRIELKMRRLDPVMAGGNAVPKDYTGTVLGMGPNHLRLRFDNAANLQDFEVYIRNDKSLYVYNGLDKTVTECKPGQWLYAGVTNNPVFGVLSGALAKDLKDRFDLKLFKEDQYYIYLDIKPKLAKDQQDFQQLRLALYGPKTDFAYLPAQVYMVKPNGETEQWKLTKPMTNIPNLDPRKVFEYENVPGFRFQRAGDPIPGNIPEQSPPAEIEQGLQCTAGWAVPVAPCDRVGRGFFFARCGLFRIREAGYKCATAGANPVTGQLSGVLSCDTPASPCLRLRLASRPLWRSRR
jgi:TIGR03009 family protein